MKNMLFQVREKKLVRAQKDARRLIHKQEE